ncbi:hypothetical protein [Acinetobacter sp. YH01009]|uniref:hypothetical protein n=1 Tax=Acinetobacter TaxID=469 RepID=UPI0015D16652|nr:hypothetical protein [Acinetobacter sp. YH01009]
MLGKIALHYGFELEVQVLKSGAGFYIGTFDCEPVSRESIEYFETRDIAEEALKNNTWTQRALDF